MTYNLVVATPIDGADVWSADVKLGWAEQLRALSHDMPIQAVVTFAQDVVRSRNRIVGIILRDYPETTHVLWWDNDQYPEDRRVVQAMLASGEDVIGAPYTNKRSQYAGYSSTASRRKPEIDGIQEVRALGFGFTMTTTKGRRNMAEHSRIYKDSSRPQTFAGCVRSVFDQVIPGAPPEDDARLSEDFSFCKRWRELGGPLYVAGPISRTSCMQARRVTVPRTSSEVQADARQGSYPPVGGYQHPVHT